MSSIKDVDWLQTQCVSNDDLELLILLPSWCWYSKHVPPHRVCTGTELRAFCMINKLSTN